MLILLEACLVIAFFGVLIWLIVTWMDNSFKREINGSNRNFKVRFNPGNNKYYIANETYHWGDIDVSKFFGLRRIYYKSKIDADFVMQKLNDEY